MTLFFKKKETFIKYLPFLIIMFLISISSTISPPSGFAMTISSVPVICIVYWLIILGKQLGVFQLFIISIYTDFLMGTPVGSYLLLFSMLRFITIVVRNKFEIDTFFKNILAAIILIIAFYVCNIFFFMIYHSKLLLTDFYILNMLATIFLYPLLAVIFQWVINIISIEKLYDQS